MADAKKRNNNNNLPAHPELEQMASSGVEMADVIALRGYVGSKPGDEVGKLYPGLEDMSISVEIPADEILATKEAPLATMPLGGVIVWVSRTADVKFRRTRTVSTTAQEVRKFFGARKAIDPTAPPTPRPAQPAQPSAAAIYHAQPGGSSGLRAAGELQPLHIVPHRVSVEM